MGKLDRTQQRIIGVLIEKQLTVPDTYPLTENAIVTGCNQKSNRDPHMELHDFEVQGALMALVLEDWVSPITGSRAKRYSHRAKERLGVDDQEIAILCELLVRGPQAPGALRPRVARLGFHAGPPEIEAVLRRLADRPTPLVEQEPRRPRERDQRWAHLLGPIASSTTEPGPVAPAPVTLEPPARSERPGLEAPVADGPSLEARVAELEARVDQLEAELESLRAGRATEA